MAFGEGAVCALRESLIRDVESPIEARAKILPRDHRGQFDELFIGKMLAEFRDLVVRRDRRCRRERRRVGDR